jgi:hypothetical protein
MIAAKHNPGILNESYVAGMNVSTSNVGLVAASGTITQAYEQLSGVADITGRYLCIAYAPVMSAFYDFGAVSTQKYGGLISM